MADRMPTDPAEISLAFTEFATDVAKGSPLYRALSERAAREPSVAEVLMAAPPAQRRPVLFLAAVHALLLDDPHGHPLAAYYPSVSGVPYTQDSATAAGDALVELVASHGGELARIVASRSTQTNEVGRCATFLPAMAMLGAEVGSLAHLDVGTSAGLNLLMPRFSYVFDGGTERERHIVGDSRVALPCATLGDVPVPAGRPDIVWSAGLDASPIDLHDPAAVTWLEACLWPDQTERFGRLVNAIAMASEAGLDVRRGDAVTDTAAAVVEATAHGHPVVTTSWVMSYLTQQQQEAVVDSLDHVGVHTDLSWVLAEAPAHTPGIPVPGSGGDEEITVLSVIRWRSGRRTVDRLATAHPHGATLRWEAGAATSFSRS
ncbi:MAG: hypothetical protein RLZ04_1926 [Actinomycetota bacterium]